MPHVSKNRLDEKTERSILKTLGYVLSKIQKNDEMNTFLLDLLTPVEQVMIAKRLTTAILIKEGYSDEDIAIKLNMTIPTIARLRYFLEARGKGYNSVWNIIQSQKLMEEIKGLLADLAGYAARAAGGRI